MRTKEDLIEDMSGYSNTGEAQVAVLEVIAEALIDIRDLLTKDRSHLYHENSKRIR